MNYSRSNSFKNSGDSDSSSDDDHNMEDSAPLLSSGTSTSNSSGSAATGKDKDPYYRVKSELDNHLSHLEECYGRYKKLYPVVDTSTHSEFLSLRRTLSKESKTVQNIVTGIKGAVDQVERYRHKFPSIRDAELSARKQYVLRAQTQLNDIRQGYDSPSVREKMKGDATRQQKIKRGGSGGSSSGSSFESEQDRTGHGHGSDHGRSVQELHMKSMIAQQDSQLEALGSAVERLGNMAGTINDELKEQNAMLAGLDDDLDDAGNKMNTVMTALAKSLRTKDSCQLYTIIVLILITLFLCKFIGGDVAVHD